jgi:hypothetical protein
VAGGYLRGFCRECGSPIINRTGPNWKRAAQFPRAMSQYGIPLAILDDPPVRPACHVFVVDSDFINRTPPGNGICP